MILIYWFGSLHRNLKVIFASRLIDERQNDPQKFLQQLGGDTAQLGGDTAKENAEAVTRG